jgi:hypothetical protein
MIAGAASGAVALFTGPSGSASLQILHAQVLVSGCEQALDHEEEAEEAAPDIGSSPTQLRLGVTVGEYDRGTVVGNVVFMLGCGVAMWAAAAVGLVSALYPKLPGLLYVPYFVLAVPTMTAATALLSRGHRAGDAALGVLGFAAVLVPLGLLAAMVSPRYFLARAYRVRPQRSSMAIVRLLHEWFDSTTEYEDGAGAEGTVERWEFAGATDYRKGLQGMGVAEQALGALTGVLAGLATTSSSAGLCTALNGLQAAAVGVFLGLLLVLKPCAVRADQWKAVGGSAVQMAAAVLGLLGRDATVPLLFVQAALGCVHLAGYLCWASIGGAARFLSLLGQRRRSQRYLRARRRELQRRRNAAALRVLEQLDHAAGSPTDALHVIVAAICSLQR